MISKTIGYNGVHNIFRQTHIHVSSPQGISTKHLKSQLHLPPVLKTLQAVAKTQVAAAEIQPAKASHGKLVQQ